MSLITKVLSKNFSITCLNICFLAIISAAFPSSFVSAQSDDCSSNLEISQDYEKSMSKPPCTVYGDLMQRSKSGNLIDFYELMFSLRDVDGYETAISNQLAFLFFEQAFSNGNVPNEDQKENIITHLTFANFFGAFDDVSSTEQQFQFLAYAVISDIFYETDLSDRFWEMVAAPGRNGLLNAKYRPVCVLRSLSPGVDEEDIYVSPDYRTCMEENKYVE